MRLSSIAEAQAAPPPEAALAGALAKDAGPMSFARPKLHEPQPGADEEPIRKDATPRKRRHRRYNRVQPAPADF